MLRQNLYEEHAQFTIVKALTGTYSLLKLTMLLFSIYGRVIENGSVPIPFPWLPIWKTVLRVFNNPLTN